MDSLSRKRIRVYADTSVFGGCYDDEFSVDSRKLFDEIVEGKFLLVISETTLLELGDAPPRVREVLTQLPLDSLEMIEISEEILALRDAYLDAEVLGGSSIRDATHVAAGSVADVDMIVSWNFKHIVHFDKIHGFHAVNLLKGYRMVEIYSPKEVVRHEEETL
ncbi:MAG: hypothetical protein WBK08_17790 [Nitrospira sp.]